MIPGSAGARTWRITAPVLSVALLIILTIVLAGSSSPVSAHPANRCPRVPAHALNLRARAGNLFRENAVIRRQRLSSLGDLGMVHRFTRSGLLRPVPAQTRTYWVAVAIPPLRVARPWTKRFIEHVSHAYYARFGERVKITSLTRTARAQHALRRSNGNAARAHGPLRSTHLTGAAVDISKRPLREAQLRWFRVALQRLADPGLVSAIEEFTQPHFHVLVHREFAGYPPARVSALLDGAC